MRNTTRTFWFRYGLGLVAIAGSGLLSGAVEAQDRIRSLPLYTQYAQRTQELNGSVRYPFDSVNWLPDGKAFEYQKDDKYYRYDIATGKITPIEKLTAPKSDPPRGRRRRGGGSGNTPERGRQFTEAVSPDEKRKAFFKDANLWLSNADNSDPVQITQDGSKKERIKYATASWVYGEELYQVTAMWWSPDSKKLAYYRFDESKVPDYFLSMNTVQVQDTLDTEAYPKAGAPNPVVDLFVYDVATQQTTRIDVRDGKPFENNVVGHYVYNIRWSPDGKELLFNRTNRLQNIMELTAANPTTGKCRVILREEWQASWTENNPYMQFLKDGKRFLFASERSGFRNFYLYDLSGKLIAPLTQHPFDVENVVRIDEDANTLYYMSRGESDPYKWQLYRVKLDGTGDTRLTDPAFHHSVQLAPDGSSFIDRTEAFDQPPVMRLVDATGKLRATLDSGDLSKYLATGFQKTERFTFKAADGKTNIYGWLSKPSHFDPTKKYPLLVSVYGGPESGAGADTFRTPDRLTELGFLVASFDGRGTSGRGKRFKDAMYGKLGQVEMDDQAAGVKFLRDRPYVDGGRVGIFGTSYGGYSSAMCLLRHPDVFQAACACSSVTDWRNYDSIYTERYMGLPQDNEKAYAAGSAMTYAGDLRGRLMLYYGTADNNVHPANTHQLITALQRAGKNFELQIGPDMGHTALNGNRMMEFFLENLVFRSPYDATAGMEGH